MTGEPVVLVALHDVKPRTGERCAEIRAWLRRRGISRCALLVVPAPGGRPFPTDAPELGDWLRAQVAAGDVVAQHGVTRERCGGTRCRRARDGDEFAGAAGPAVARKLDVGARVLRAAGLPPRGFVAPGYRYTRALRGALATRYGWSADLLGLWVGDDRVPAPVLALGRSTAARRALSPPLVRARARWAGPVLRLDVHPADFDRRTHVDALEAVLERARGRASVTPEELAPLRAPATAPVSPVTG